MDNGAVAGGTEGLGAETVARSGRTHPGIAAAAGGEETTAGEDGSLKGSDVDFEQAGQSAQARRRGMRGLDNGVAEHLLGCFDGGDLQILLGAEVSEEAALAHVELFGEFADAQGFEPALGGDVD